MAASPQTSTTTCRRVHRAKWSHKETMALMEVYRDKWYSVQRGCLSTSNWQEVADEVAARSNLSSAKSSSQCCQKIDRFRACYSKEMQRYPYSSRVHFTRMGFLENGVRVNVLGCGSGYPLPMRPSCGSGEGRTKVMEMVDAIKRLGNEFVRIEKMKIDMAKEIELMRMEMETKRTKMILQSQQRLKDLFTNAGLKNKNKK